MKINEFIYIETEKLLLVPYEEYHVSKYHDWMQSEQLQRLTNSEPLSLDEEYSLQKSWRSDENKLTFIILRKDGFNDINPSYEANEVKSMIGDINIFLCDSFEEGDDGVKSAEIELMIAEEEYRRRGLGRQSVIAVMRYAAQYTSLKFDLFSVKIGLDNAASQNLFRKLGFVDKNRNEYFKEIEMTLCRNDVAEMFNDENDGIKIFPINKLRCGLISNTIV